MSDYRVVDHAARVSWRRLLRSLAAGVFGLLSLAGWHGTAWAGNDVWAFVDTNGKPHFADHRVDDRYELFFRATESFDTTQDPPPEPSAHAPLDSNFKAPGWLMNFFENSPSFKTLEPHLREASNAHSIDIELLQALIAAESAFNTYAVSPKGAVGLMQIMPDTARRYGVDGDKRIALAQKLTDPRTNIRTGSRYLRDLINMFPGQLELAIASYNAGEGAVMRAGNRIPNYKETQAYVKTVLQLYHVLKPPAPPTLRHPPTRTRATPQIAGGAQRRGNLPPTPEDSLPTAAPASTRSALNP